MSPKCKTTHLCRKRQCPSHKVRSISTKNQKPSGLEILSRILGRLIKIRRGKSALGLCKHVRYLRGVPSSLSARVLIFL